MSITLAIHIGGAAVGLCSGIAALAFRKGASRHRMAGRVFLISMLVAATSAALLAWTAAKWMDVCSGILTCYFVLTAWTTVRSASRPAEVGLLALAVATLLGYLALEWVAARTGIHRPGVPAGAGYVFATVLALAATGDARLLLGRRIAGPARIVRHLWRMCFALFMATGSFFLGRMPLFPEVLRDTGVLYALALAPLLMMLIWWLRVCLTARRRTAGTGLAWRRTAC